MTPRSPIFVAGHRRPDTDAAVAACMLARLRSRQYRQQEYRPILLGEPNAQTCWLFERAGLPLPPVKPDIRYTVGEVMNPRPVTLGGDNHLADAVPLFQRLGTSAIPVVDADGRLTGVVSPQLPHSELLLHFNVEDYLGHLLELEDVVAALRLRVVQRGNNAARPTARRGVFRVASGDWHAGPGDVVLAAPGDDIVARAAAGPARAVIIADGAVAAFKATAAAAPDLPVYHYRGSLMALLANLPLAIPVRAIMATNPVTLRAEQRVEQVRETLAHERHAVPVVDDTGRLLGLLSRSDVLGLPARRLILVDHFEKTQTVVGVEQAEIVEIVDHHRIGGIETWQPARVDCRPLGSSSTIVALQFAEGRLVPARNEALLLLGAIISDTLLLTSPTTTALDRKVARTLARRAGVALAEFGREVLRRNDELADGAPAALVEKDLKEFQHGSLRFAAAQIETTDLALLVPARSAALLAALEAVRARLGCAFASLIVTDVFRQESQMLVADANAARQAWLLEGAPAAIGRRHPGLVSRKQQLLPLLIRRLNTYQE